MRGGYSFSGASIPDAAKTYSVAYFPNNAPMVAPTLSSALTDALQDKFARQTKLQLVPTGGDLAFEGEITKQYIFLEEGVEIGKFTGSNQTIGILLLRFATRKQMESFFEEPNRYIKVVVE